MPVPSLFGDGATLGLGGGPIRSQDQNLATFATGAVTLGGGGISNTVMSVALVILIGVILWLLYLSNRS